MESITPRLTLGRFLRIIPLVLIGVLAPATLARADSASIGVTNTAGQSDPAAGVPRVFTVSGDASLPEQVFVKFRPIGGAPCAPNAESDSGSTFGSAFYHDLAYGSYVNGLFGLQGVYSWQPSGTYMFCIWLPKSEPYENAEKDITTPISLTITFRSPTGAISGTVSPANPRPGERATLTVTGASESPEQVFARIRPAGGASCAPTYEADTGESLLSEQQVNGSFSVKATVTQSYVGSYLVCMWLADSASSTPAVAGPQPLIFTVGAPAPSRVCLRDRSEVGRQASLVRRYEARLRSRRLSKRSRRGYQRALTGARHRLAAYESLRRGQCPYGR